MGIILYIFSYINYKIFTNHNNIVRFFSTVVMVCDFNLLYIVGLYYINNGLVHIYFLLTLSIAFVLSVNIMPMVTKSDNYFKKK